jgi:CRISPR system Cascade subunit CasE
MHAAVLASFPPDVLGTEKRVLWRVDTSPDHRIDLYVVSPVEPDMTHLVEQAGWLTSGWETRNYQPLLERITTTQRWGFRITANPVHHVVVDSETGQRKRLGHVTVVQQVGWLLERAERNGFKVVEAIDGEPDVAVSDRRTRRFRRGNNTVTLVTSQFDGHLEVTDVEAMRNVLVNGLGRAKGYGCGLLTLARAR